MTASADIPSRTEIRSAERRTAATVIQLGLQVFSQMSTRTRDSRSKLGLRSIVLGLPTNLFTYQRKANCRNP